MAVVEHSALVAVSAEQMYELVNDIEAYPQFLPWCKAATVTERSEVLVIASLELAKGSIGKLFTTRNTLSFPNKMVMELVDGPFKHFIGEWTFTNLDAQACRVNFSLDFAFKNKFMGLALQPLVDHISNTIVDLFVERAHVKYSYASGRL